MKGKINESLLMLMVNNATRAGNLKGLIDGLLIQMEWSESSRIFTIEESIVNQVKKSLLHRVQCFM